MKERHASAVVVSSPGTLDGLASRYAAIRAVTEGLCRPLSPEDQMLQSMPDCSPGKWHQAHTTWFFETFILHANQPGYELFDRDFPFVFNSYYKQLGGHPQRGYRGLFSRPPLERVLDYRRHVDRHMLDFISRNDILTPELRCLVELGLNHEQQHQELILTDIKHGFWSQPLRPAYAPAAAEGRSSGGQAGAPQLAWFSFEEGIYSLGHASSSFAFDNETPRHEVYLQGFRLGSRLATNGEYLEFIDDGGYRRPELWLSDGWDTVASQRWSAPLYWEQRDGAWFAFTLAGLRPVDPREPVAHVSYYEADAFARWAGARLATEAEWEVAAAGCPIEGNLLESASYHPRPLAQPAEAFPAQLFGDVWEWTASPYSPYPGFRPAAGALGEYNGKFMCNQMVLRGGSCATPASHLRASYRNFFPPHARWQFSGIRLAKDGGRESA